MLGGIVGCVVAMALAGNPFGSLLPEAKTAMKSTNLVTVSNKWSFLRFEPTSAAKHETCFIFYPGGLVNPKAYAPLANRLASEGHLSYVVEVLGRLAILSPNAADKAKKDRKAEHCRKFVIGGHSLGGVVATNYVIKHPDNGLLLLASFPQDGKDSTGIHAPVTSIYGSKDCQTTVDDITSTRSQLPLQTKYVKVDGGDHQQFAWYAASDDDECKATISRQQQFEAVVQGAKELLASM